MKNLDTLTKEQKSDLWHNLVVCKCWSQNMFYELDLLKFENFRAIVEKKQHYLYGWRKN